MLACGFLGFQPVITWGLHALSTAGMKHHDQAEYRRKGLSGVYGSRGLRVCYCSGGEAWQKADMAAGRAESSHFQPQT